MTTPTTVEDLPNEVLAHIFSYLDGPAPSDSRLHDQPDYHMLTSVARRLKHTSLVSKRWRAVVRPLLFRHVVWDLSRFDIYRLRMQQNEAYQAKRKGKHRASERDKSALDYTEEEDSANIAERIEMLAYLREHDIASYVRTLTLIVRDPELDPAASLPSDSVLVSEMGYEQDANYVDDNNWLWRALFNYLNPRRVTLLATPRTLASVFARRIFLGDAWTFNNGPHILSLSLRDADSLPGPTRKRQWESESEAGSGEEDEGRDESTPADDLDWKEPAEAWAESARPDNLISSSVFPPESLRPTPCELFVARPWHSCLLNEGPMLRAYKTYEFFLKRPPSIIGALLGYEANPNDTALLTRSIRDFSYVAIFPLSAHFQNMIRHLPRLDRIFVQLVPRNGILHDAEEMRHVDAGDLWMERNTAYSLLMGELFDDGVDTAWLGLRVFESGDAADREAWRMAVNYAEFSGVKGWRVERDGVFVRHDEKGQPLSLAE